MTENIARKYNYQDKEFIVDQSKGCYLEVTHREQVGYVGVRLQGTTEKPYGWDTNKNRVTDDGLRTDRSVSGEIGDNLDRLCQELIRLQQDADAQKAFDKEKACQDLHGFFKNLGE